MSKVTQGRTKRDRTESVPKSIVRTSRLCHLKKAGFLFQEKHLTKHYMSVASDFILSAVLFRALLMLFLSIASISFAFASAFS